MGLFFGLKIVTPIRMRACGRVRFVCIMGSEEIRVFHLATTKFGGITWDEVTFGERWVKGRTAWSVTFPVTFEKKLL